MNRTKMTPTNDRSVLTRRFVDQSFQQRKSKLNGRINLCSRIVTSIDREGTRKIDDAFSVCLEGAVARLDVHTTDIASWTGPGSLLNQVIRTSDDEPDNLLVPRPVVDRVLSLRSGHRRLALTVSMWFDESGERRMTQVLPSEISCDSNLGFARADQILRGEVKPQTRSDRRLVCEVNRLNGLAKRLDRVHAEQGVLPTESNDWGAESMVRSLMHETGLAVAEICHRYEVPVQYRVQEPPDKRHWNQLRQYFADQLIELPYRVDPKALARAMRSVMQDPERRRVCRQVCLNNLRQAANQSTPNGHFSMGNQRYVQATSPLRKASQLANQRSLCNAISKLDGVLCISRI